MRRSGLLAAIAVTAVTACGLSVVGIDPLPITGSEPDARASTSSSSSSGTVANEGGDAPSTACPPAPAAQPVARHRTDITIDGDGKEWPCESRVAFDRNTPGGGNDGSPSSLRAEVGLAWDDKGLYFMAQVFTPEKPAGDDVVPWKNDAIELYLGTGSATNTSGPLTSNDHQVVVDYKGLALAYGPAENVPVAVPDLVTMAIASDRSFTVEVFFSKAALGIEPNADMKNVFYNVQIDGHVANDLRPAFWMYQKVPNQSCRQPRCGTDYWGVLDFGD